MADKGLETKVETEENPGGEEAGTVSDLSPTGTVDKGDVITLQVWDDPPAPETEEPDNSDPGNGEKTKKPKPEKTEEPDNSGPTEDPGEEDPGEGEPTESSPRVPLPARLPGSPSPSRAAARSPTRASSPVRGRESSHAMSEPHRIGGRYEVGELLGRGGMAEVRKGTDVRLGRTVAIKRLRTDLASDTTFQARFRREAQSAASLNHPAIVSVYDTGEEMSTDGSNVAQPYIVMEYVAGRTLRDIIREGRKILPERALEITSGVLAALDYSHRAGIIHRDIKPGNVMLTPSGDVKVMDFGIARAVSDASNTMTQTAAVVGTAQYLSPEQARGETVDSRSDVYSTGCQLYELLTGRPPFVGDSPVSVAYQHVREQAPPPSSLDEDLTPELDAIVMKSLAKNVGDRYPSAAAMKADIDRYLAGQPVQAPAVAPMAATGLMPTTDSTQLSDHGGRRRRGARTPAPWTDHPAGAPPAGPDRRRPDLRAQALRVRARAAVRPHHHRAHP